MRTVDEPTALLDTFDWQDWDELTPEQREEWEGKLERAYDRQGRERFQGLGGPQPPDARYRAKDGRVKF